MFQIIPEIILGFAEIFSPSQFPGNVLFGAVIISLRLRVVGKNSAAHGKFLVFNLTFRAGFFNPDRIYPESLLGVNSLLGGGIAIAAINCAGAAHSIIS